MYECVLVVCFVFLDTATTWSYPDCHTLSLHVALPVYPVHAVPGAGSGVHPRRRLYGGRRGGGAGGARFVWARNPSGERRRRADQLPHAAPPLDTVRDGRGQAAREAPGLRGASVDRAPPSERERITRATTAQTRTS